MRVLSVFRFIIDLIISVSGKILGHIATPIIFPHRDWINNYAHNFILKHGLRLNRSTVHSEDSEKYYTKNGYILKRKTNIFIGVLVLIPWFFIDNDASLTSASLQEIPASNVTGLVHIGSYFDLGDRQRENKISIWTNWQNFKDFYYWMVRRNGFYNYNYLIEDGYVDSCGTFDLPPNNRIHESWKPANFSEHSFYKDSNGKWFFICTLSRIIKGKAYGYEVGFRRLNNGGVNAVFRVYFKKEFKAKK